MPLLYYPSQTMIQAEARILPPAVTAAIDRGLSMVDAWFDKILPLPPERHENDTPAEKLSDIGYQIANETNAFVNLAIPESKWEARELLGNRLAVHMLIALWPDDDGLDGFFNDWRETGINIQQYLQSTRKIEQTFAPEDSDAEKLYKRAIDHSARWIANGIVANNAQTLYELRASFIDHYNNRESAADLVSLDISAIKELLRVMEIQAGELQRYMA